MAASDIFFADLTDLLFRDVRNLSKPSGRGGRNKEAIDWLAGLGDASPEQLAHELVKRLAAALVFEHDPNRRLALLCSCEEAATTVLAELELATSAAALPLLSAGQRAAHAADSLLKAMSIAYARIAEGMNATERSAGLEETARLAALRAMRVLGRRQLLAYRACATASAAAWKSMHDLYALSHRHGLAATRDGQSSIQQEYLTALLLAIADPVRLPRAGLQAVQDFAATVAPLARIEDGSRYKNDGQARGSVFVLTPDRGRGGHGMNPLWKDQTLPPNGLVVDCTRIIAALDESIEGRGAEPALPVETLRLLRDAWGGDRAGRRFARTQFMPRADMVVGIREILAFFAATAFGRRNSDEGREAREAAAASEWSIVNESPDGFGIRFLGGTRPPLDIGDLTILCPREHNQVCVCIVRRISHAAGHLEIGLQQLCGQAGVVNLPSDDISAFGQQAILLPQLPGFGNASGVIAAAGLLKPHTIITAAAAGGDKRYKLGSRVASSTAIEFHLLQAA